MRGHVGVLDIIAEIITNEVFKNYRSAGSHCITNIRDVRKHFVLDLYRICRYLGDVAVNGCDGSHGVAPVERLLIGHDVVGGPLDIC